MIAKCMMKFDAGIPSKLFANFKAQKFPNVSSHISADISKNSVRRVHLQPEMEDSAISAH